jgi:hypothetical protein
MFLSIAAVARSPVVLAFGNGIFVYRMLDGAPSLPILRERTPHNVLRLLPAKFYETQPELALAYKHLTTLWDYLPAVLPEKRLERERQLFQKSGRVRAPSDQKSSIGLF